MSEQKISTQVKEQAEATEKEDAAANEQKESQIAEQEQAKEDQNSAAVEKAAGDAQAAIAKANRALSELPKKIDEQIASLKDTLDSILGKTIPPSGDPDNIDFDPNAILAPLKSAVNPVVGAIGPVESIVGPVPVLGDLIGMMSGMASNANPSSLSKEDIKKLVPKPPSVPENLKSSLNAVMDDVNAFCSQLPMLLIDIIFQMLAVIPDMFNAIAGVIGVPTIPYPLNLVSSMPPLVPKIKKLVTELPSQVYKLVEGVIKQKYAEAMALAVPAPPTATPEQLAEIEKKKAKKAAEEAKKKAEAEAKAKEESSSGESSSTETKTEETTTTKTVPEPTQTPPATSSIPETPSITPPEPKAPKAPDPKPEPELLTVTYCLTSNGGKVLPDVFYDSIKQLVAKISEMVGEKNIKAKNYGKKEYVLRVTTTESCTIEQIYVPIKEFAKSFNDKNNGLNPKYIIPTDDIDCGPDEQDNRLVYNIENTNRLAEDDD